MNSSILSSSLNKKTLIKAIPAAYAQFVSQGRWKPAKHLMLLNRKLMDVTAGRIKRLIITMPPRSGKSEFTSKIFPAWYLGNFPDNRIILASYEATFAEQWGAAARDIFEEYNGELFNLELKKGMTASRRWGIEDHLGSMMTAGVGGPLTGKGGNLIIIDDPVKNDEEANSQTMRDKLWSWFGTTLMTRLQPGGSVLLIMTRWHFDDLAGRILDLQKSPNNEKWEHLNFPAISEIDELPEPEGLGRKKGEALWPEMWPIEKLEAIKNSGTLSSYAFSSLYQQKPTPEGGGFFKQDWFRYYTIQGNYYLFHPRKIEQGKGLEFIPINQCWRLITVDTANKVKETSDMSAIAVWAITPKTELLLVELYRGHYGYEEILSRLVLLNKEYKPRYIGIENTGIAIQLITEARNKGLAVRALEPHGEGKQNRANAPLGAIVRMESGKILFPKEARFLYDLETELLFFPKGSYDDCVDVLSYAANELTKFDAYEIGDFTPYTVDNTTIGVRKGNNFIGNPFMM